MMKKMKIMSFNTQHCLNYIERKIDFQVMADAIKKCNADVVGLNEMYDKGVHPDFDAQVRILSEKTGLKYYYFAKTIEVGENNPYGNGFLSRIPIMKAETILIPNPEVKANSPYYETRCILKAQLENGVTVLVTHFGLTPEEQENAVKTVVKNLYDNNCILMGDFNVTPDNNLLLPIRERMRDTAQTFTKELFSFPSDKPTRKIDYIFVSSDIEIVDADIPAIIVSDHRPHTATLMVK